MPFMFTRNLYSGMRGKDVEHMQMMLDEMNAYYKFNKQKQSLPVTGFFGDETKRFVTWFQLFVGVYPADGIIDRRTYSMMEARYNNFISSTYNSYALNRY